MKRAYISLGGNLGFPIDTVKQALQRIANLEEIQSFRHSSLYETDPISSIPQNPFINAVCSFDTDLTPEALLKELQEIERDLGKIAKGKEEPRVIDLDLLFVGQEERNTEELTLPHPEWKNRLFVLQPLLELDEVIFLKEGMISIKQLVEALGGCPQSMVRMLCC